MFVGLELKSRQYNERHHKSAVVIQAHGRAMLARKEFGRRRSVLLDDIHPADLTLHISNAKNVWKNAAGKVALEAKFKRARAMSDHPESSPQTTRKEIFHVLWLMLLWIALILMGGLFFYLMEFEKAELRLKAVRSELEDLKEFFAHNETIMEYLKNHRLALAGLEEGGLPNDWNYGASVYFAFTIATTIGYGNFAPTSTISQLFTVIYGIVAIPIAGYILVAVATEVLKFFTYVYLLMFDKVNLTFDELDEDHGGFLDHVEMRRGLEELQIDLSDDDFTRLMEIIDEDGNNEISKDEFKEAVSLLHADLSEVSGRSSQMKITIVLVLVWVGLGSLYFAIAEDWGYGQALFFSFVTLSTIGLGDFTPSNQVSYIVLYIFTLTGLGLLAVFINLVAAFAEGVRKEAQRLSKRALIKAKRKAQEVRRLSFPKEINGKPSSAGVKRQ